MKYSCRLVCLQELCWRMSSTAKGKYDDGVPMQDVSHPKKGKGSAAVEEIYQKKTQLEHILLRPDTYIGEPFL